MALLRRIANALLDVLLPRRREERWLASCTPTLLAKKLSPKEAGGVLTLFDYKDPCIKHLIWALKYRGNKHAAKLSAGVLADVLLEDVSEKKLFSTYDILLVPVPLAKERRQERGFNQVELVLELLEPKLDGCRHAPHVLVKVCETPPQTTLPRAARLENVRGVFSAPAPNELVGRTVFLFDDVTTTGATLKEARRVLMRAGAEVRMVALAR